MLNVKIDNSFDILEILSLKLDQENLYHLPKSNYGVIVGRVIANKGFGVPNAKISVFIPRENDEELTSLYSYSSPFSNGEDGVRYNLLPSMVNEECHQDVGTFFTKKTLLDNNTAIEIFEKYYKFTTTTNSAGDFFLSGIPTGMQQVHMDLDMSDCGVLSQTPRDMIYKGYNINQFESNVQFKKSTNLNNLAQIFTQNKSIYVYPFWGDTTDEDTNITITRCDIEIDYEFEPTCIFMGSVITDTGEASLSKKCQPDVMLGKMSNMVTGEGSIEMIRKTPNGKVEEFSVKGQKLIDGNGVWCYQIPMNLDYVTTDEFGNLVASDNPNKGIATRTRVRFRISMMDIEGDEIARKRARYLVPNNPLLDSEYYPEFNRNHEFDYEFGSLTADENFRDLYWNKVYTVKSYIPRLQKKSSVGKKNYIGIKAVNHYGDNNPMPYNNIQIKFNFTYRFICTFLMLWFRLIAILNKMISPLAYALLKVGKFLYRIGKFFSTGGNPRNREDEENSYGDVGDNEGKKSSGFMTVGCRFIRIALQMPIGFDSDLCEEIGGIPVSKFYPGINSKMYNLIYDNGGWNGSFGSTGIERELNSPTGRWGAGCFGSQWVTRELLTSPIYTELSGLINCIENALATENEVISFNFHNDWINGVLYFPLWMRVIRPKKTFFLGLFKIKAKDTYCRATEHPKGRGLKIYHPCAPIRSYEGDNLKPLFTTNTFSETNPSANNNYDPNGTITVREHLDKWLRIIDFYTGNGVESNGFRFKSHKKTIGILKTDNGVIVEKETKLGEYVYYYACGEYQQGGNEKFKSQNNVVKQLFATDIVLLGSLDKCDVDGVPQFFKELSSTTYNMPPSLLSLDYEINDEKDKENSTGLDSDKNDDLMEGIIPNSIHTEYSGADWGDSSYDMHYNTRLDYDENRNERDDRDDENNTRNPNGDTPPETNNTGNEWTLKSMVNRLLEAIISTDSNVGRPIAIPIIPGGEQFDNGGLFYGITCNSSYVKPKSCINLSRQCEFGVTLDQSIDIPGDLQNVENDNSYGLLLPDGFISYDEIISHDGRSMFATMNHDLLKYKYDERTGYKKTDFRHKYIDNFDGSLRNLMINLHSGYGNNIETTPTLRNYVSNYKLETINKDYVRFRFGGNVNYYNVNGQFLLKDVRNRIPQYRNSFYFYFGLKEGKTAIDRFRNEYYGSCPNDRSDYSVKTDFRPNSWCGDSGYFSLYARGITTPYTVSFQNNDDLGAENIFLSGVSSEKIYLSPLANPTLEEDGYVWMKDENDNPIELPNGHYTITITDSDGITTSMELPFVAPRITAQINSVNFIKSNDELFNEPGITYEIVANNTITTGTNITRDIGGCILISNLRTGTDNNSDDVKITITPANQSDFLPPDPTLGGYTGFEYTVTLGGSSWGWHPEQDTMMGKIKYENSSDSYFITLPKGGILYNVKLTMLCDGEETQNQIDSNIYVSEGTESTILINGVDYRLLSGFDSGVDNDGIFTPSNVRGWVDIDNISYADDNIDFLPTATSQTRLLNKLETNPLPSSSEVINTINLLSTEVITGSDSSYRWPKSYRLLRTDMSVNIQSYDIIPSVNLGMYIYHEYNDVISELCPRPDDWIFSINDTYANIAESDADTTFHTYRRIIDNQLPDGYAYYHYTLVPHKELYEWNGTSYEQVVVDGHTISDYQDYPNFDYEGYYDGMTDDEKESWVGIINTYIDRRYDVVVKMKDAFWIQDYQKDMEDNEGNTLSLTTDGYDLPYTKVIKYTDYKDNPNLPVQTDISLQAYNSTTDNKLHIWYPLIDMDDSDNTLMWNNKLPYAIGMECGNGTKMPTTIGINTSIHTTNKTKILSEFTKLQYMDKTFDFKYVCWGETGDLNSGVYRIWDYDARPISGDTTPGSNSPYPITKNGMIAFAIENGIIKGDIDYDNNARVNFTSQRLVNDTTGTEIELNICNFRENVYGRCDTENRMPTRRTLVEDLSMVDEINPNLTTDSNTNPTLNNYMVWDESENRLQLQTFPRNSSDTYSVDFTHHYMGYDVQPDELQGVSVKPGLKVNLEGSILVKNSYYDADLSSVVNKNDLTGCFITPNINSDELNIGVTYYLVIHEYDAVRDIPIDGGNVYADKAKYMVKHPYIDHYKHFNDNHDYFEYATANDNFGYIMKPYNKFTFTRRVGFYDISYDNNIYGIEFTDEDGNIITFDEANGTSFVIGKCYNGEDDTVEHNFDMQELFGTYSLSGVSNYVYNNYICSSALFYVIAKDDNSRTLAASPLIDMIDWQAQIVYFNNGDITLRIHKPSYKNSNNTADDTLRYYYYFTKPLIISPTKDDESYYFEVDIPTCTAQQINMTTDRLPRWWEITLRSGQSITTDGITFINDSQKTLQDVITDYWDSSLVGSVCNLYYIDIAGIGHYSEHIPVADETNKWGDDLSGLYSDGTDDEDYRN